MPKLTLPLIELCFYSMLIGMGLIIVFNNIGEDSMAKCMKVHSYDVCVSILR